MSKVPLELVYRQFGLRLENIRNAIGMTQEELAKKVGLNRTSIVNIESGKQRILMHTVEAFAAALGTTPKHLMRGIWT